MRPRLLDLFCGAGGAAVGYSRAGFEVVGVDLYPQPHYPFEFHRADALRFPLEGFDVIHASPPCQAFTLAHRINGYFQHPDYIAPIRSRLVFNGVPWVIENVPGAPLVDPVTLCGTMFGLGVDRDRWFESSEPLAQPSHPAHRPTTKMGRPLRPGTVVQVVGHFSGVADARRAMGIDWMTRDELAQAIPPAYTEWVGHQLARLTEVPA